MGQDSTTDYADFTDGILTRIPIPNTDSSFHADYEGLRNFPLARVFNVADFKAVQTSASFTTLCRAVLTVLATQCVLALPTAVGSPYSEIAERNAFGLLPPAPDRAPEPEKEPEPPPNIKVTGITTLMGIPRALVQVQFPARPPQPARVESYILVAGGDPQGGVQVLEIQDSPDTKDVKVKVRQDGKVSWLGLEKGTANSAAAKPPPGATPGRVATAQAAAQRLAAARAAANRRTPGGFPQPGTTAIPTRNIRTPQTQSAPGTTGYAPGTTLGLGQGSANRPRVFQARDQVGDLTPDEQVILIEANRLNTLEDQAAGTVPPPPPTVMTPPELDPTVQPEPDPLEQLIPGSQ